MILSLDVWKKTNEKQTKTKTKMHLHVRNDEVGRYRTDMVLP